jgi:AcrR family transcriptional regulator
VPSDAATPTRGHKKKARTRELLVRAAAEVIAERGEAFSITEVVERAGVSNGTFYNYFDDRNDLVDQLVAAMIGDFTAGADAIVATADPALRFATISAMLLEWAATSPALAHAILRLEVLHRSELDAALFGHLRRDLADGVAAGMFEQPADAATVDVVGGSLLMAARRLVAAGPDQQYQQSIIVRLLLSLGVTRRKADATAARAVADAHTTMPAVRSRSTGGVDQI